MINCLNKGNVYGDLETGWYKWKVGGIAGGGVGTISGCANDGMISGGKFCGGIVGQFGRVVVENGTCVLENCRNRWRCES